MAFRVAVLVLLVVASLPLASSWGVAPARRLVPFEPGLHELEVSLENPSLEEGYFEVSFGGSLASYASYDGGLIHVTPGDDRVEVPFSLRLPSDVEPGRQVLEVRLQQRRSGDPGATVSSLMGLTSVVVVFAPRVGQHVDAEVVVGRDSGGGVPFTVSLLNTGSETVPVWAEVSVKSPLNAEVAFLETGRRVLAPDEPGKVVASWSGEKRPGAYYAEVAVHYGDKVKVLRESFVVGSSELSFVGVRAPGFRLGGIAPLEVEVANRWNTPAEDVYAEVFVLSDGRIVQSFKTPSEDIGSYSGATLRGFWDTSSLVVGPYELQVKVSGGGGSSQETVPVVVKMDRLEVGNAVSGEVVADSSSVASGDSLLVLLILVVVVTNIVLLARLKRWRR